MCSSVRFFKTNVVRFILLPVLALIAIISSEKAIGQISTNTFTHVVFNNFGPSTDTNVLPILLTATLIDPVDVDLKWRCRIPNVSGYFIDFNMGADRMFEILDVEYSNVTTFHHPNLKPNTRFAYRLRPFFGKTSNVACVTTGEATDDQSQCDDVGLGMAPLSERGTNSMKNPLTLNKAAPSDLTAIRVSPRVIDLNWKDDAKDADGYLVEYSFGSDKDFHIVGVFKPHAMSYRLAMLPPDMKCYFRVRAFCEGSPSLAVELNTSIVQSIKTQNLRDR